MADLSNKHILMVLTSHSALGNTGEKTGVWIEEFAAPYFAFKDAGIKVTVATVDGGQPPIDPKSEMEAFQTPATKRFDLDLNANYDLANAVALSDVNHAMYDAVFYPGGHGPLWDLTHDKDSIVLIEQFIAHRKPVAAVCHASAVLLEVNYVDNTPIIKNKAVTGFTNSEEEAVGLTNVVPFLLETELIAKGAKFKKAGDWQPNVVQDGLIITGQNPASSTLVAEKLMQELTHSGSEFHMHEALLSAY